MRSPCCSCWPSWSRWICASSPRCCRPSRRRCTPPRAWPPRSSTRSPTVRAAHGPSTASAAPVVAGRARVGVLHRALRPCATTWRFVAVRLLAGLARARHPADPRVHRRHGGARGGRWWWAVLGVASAGARVLRRHRRAGGPTAPGARCCSPTLVGPCPWHSSGDPPTARRAIRRRGAGGPLRRLCAIRSPASTCRSSRKASVGARSPAGAYAAARCG